MDRTTLRKGPLARLQHAKIIRRFVVIAMLCYGFIEAKLPSAYMQIQIDYRLTDCGWAECKVVSGEQICVLTASYLSNALGNLVLAANAVLAGFSRVTFGFDEEPGEFRWVITSSRLNEIQIEILEFDELWGGKPDAEGKSLYRSLCRPVVFAIAVEKAAQSVLATHGEAGYLEKWAEHSFPTAQYTELAKAIAQAGEGT